MTTLTNLELARGLLIGYKAAKRGGMRGVRLKGIREQAYICAAFAAQDYIKAQLAGGRRHVFYSDICELLGTSRYTVAQVLESLQEMNTHEGQPLWPAFVGYKSAVRGNIGDPGGSFYTCALWLKWKMKKGEQHFLNAMRQRGLEELGLT